MSGFLTQEMKARGSAQVIVVFKAATDAAPARSASASKRIAPHFARSPLGRPQALAASVATPAAAATPYRVYPHLGVMLGTVDKAGLAALRADPDVQSVGGAPSISLIWPQRVAAASLSKKYSWGIEKLGVRKLWDQGLTGKGVLVGHLDTGVDAKHPALKGAIVHFAQFDLMGRRKTPDPKPTDSDDHGTHTAATIAGRPVGGRHVGVAPGATLASAMVIEGGDAVARVLGGMDWAIGHGVRVLNMSLGFRGWWEDFRELTKILRRKGVLPVFAVGNEYAGSSRSPGNYSEAISVGACDSAGSVADFSSSQRFQRRRDPVVPDLVGPGVDVISAKPGGGYQSMDGSSMATPHIAGLAALLLEARPGSTVSQIEKAIFASCKRPAGMSAERGGRGIPSAVKALAAL